MYVMFPSEHTPPLLRHRPSLSLIFAPTADLPPIPGELGDEDEYFAAPPATGQVHIGSRQPLIALANRGDWVDEPAYEDPNRLYVIEEATEGSEFSFNTNPSRMVPHHRPILRDSLLSPPMSSLGDPIRRSSSVFIISSRL